MKFYLGTHVMSHIQKSSVPLFISFRQIKNRRKPIKQSCSIALDSGGFSELSLFGKWQTTPREYIREVERLNNVAGLSFDWIAQQDYMTEPNILDKTGLTLGEHQSLTVRNFEDLNALEHEQKITPVLQGQTLGDYFRHFEQFEEAGFDLRKMHTVGVGSICRRQGSDEVAHILRCLGAKGLKLHGFGVKALGIKKAGSFLFSADSMAWSFGARYSKGYCAEHKQNPTTKSCNNCLTYALEWRDKIGVA